MACFGINGDKHKRPKTGCFERSSPALQQIILQLFRENQKENKWVPLITRSGWWSGKNFSPEKTLLPRAEKPMEMDHHIYEFGSVEYHIQSSVSDPHNVYLSISTPVLSTKILVSQGLCPYTIQKVKGICPRAVEVIDPARGYQLTLQLNISNIPQGKDGMKIIKEIAAIESVILSSQLKEMLQNFSSQDAPQGTCKPIKFVYHPKKPIFFIRQPHKLKAVFPMRFKETSDVIIATSFFQELVDVGNCEAWAKAPSCTWSPIPPPELRGEAMQDLSTNAGFISFDIFSRHVDEKRLDKTVWNLLNFYPYVKSHIMCTKGFIQRKMRKRLDDLVKILHQPNLDEDENTQKAQGCLWTASSVKFPKFTKLRKRYGDFNRKINRIRYRIKIHGFGELNRKIRRIHHRLKIRGFSHIRHQWFSIPKFRSAKGYTRLD